MAVRFRPGQRVAADPGTALIALGDVAAIGLFVATGLYAHAMPPMDYPMHALGTATPFVLGWLVVAPPSGVFASATVGSVRATVRRVPLAWTGAALVGAAMRATPLFHGGAPPSFVAVNVALGLPFLLAWRLAVAWLVPGGRSA